MVAIERAKKLDAALRRLYRDRGVLQDNLKTILHDDLVGLFQIKPTDSVTRTREKVVWHLEELIKRLEAEDNQTVAQYTFNITGDPEISKLKGSTERQAALPKSVGSERTASGRMTNEILPFLVNELLTDPPGPMPEPVTPGETVAEPPTPVQVEVSPKPGESEPEPKRKGGLLIGGGLGAAVVIAAVIVFIVSLESGDGDNRRAGGDRGQTQAPGAAATQGQRLTFDDLGGGSPIIQVYPGVTDSARDKQHNGTFNAGDTVSAVCKTKGRSISSAPQLGEQERTADDWIRIHGTPGEAQYATAVYVANPDALLGKLPEC